MARLFVAVRPPAEVLAAIAALPRPDEPGVRWVPPDQWHVTLRFLGDADPEAVSRAIDAASHDLQALGSVEAKVGPRVSRLGRAVICLPVGGLGALASVVGAATATVGEPPDLRPFAGHLTLARLRHRGACRLTGRGFDARFDVTGIELVRSVLGHGGAQHEVVRAWSLAG